MSLDLNRPIILYMHAGSGNHGCEAIADTTVRIIRKRREESGADVTLPVIVATNSEEEDRKYMLGSLEKEGLCTIVEERHIDRKFVDHVLYYIYRKITGDRESFLRYRFKKVLSVYEMMMLNRPAENKPLAISIGGDNYCYPEMLSDLMLAHGMFRNKGFETVLWGCSIEPASLKNVGLVKDLMEYDRIYARESITYDALLHAGIVPDKLELRKDPAFELETADIRLPEGFSEGKIVGINLSPMVLDRAKDKELVRESYRKFIDYILKNTDQNIMFVPHVVWKSNDDRKPLTEFYEEYKDSGRVFLLEDGPAEVLKGYISKCSFFVGARTHSTIAAYSSGVKTLVIGYSVKSRGIAKDLFGNYEHYVLPVQEMEDADALISGYEWIMRFG